MTQILLLLSPFLLVAGCAGGDKSASPEPSRVQGRGIQLLTSWLKSWKMALPTPTPSAQVRKMGGLSSTALDRELLRQLIKNQQETIRLPTREQAASAFSPARQLAERTVKSSTGALATMRVISADLNAE